MAHQNDDTIDAEFSTLDVPNDRGAMITHSGGTVLARPTFQLACRTDNPRKLPLVERKLVEEANLAGGSFIYGWGKGDDRIEGPTVKLAMAAVRVWGNSAVEQMPVQDAGDAWIFTARFIDLETGFTLERQFRQSKKSKVHGKHDEERKADIRFQIGQSKASRNVVLNALPEWLIDNAMEAAKKGVRDKIGRWIESRGLAATQDFILAELAKASAPTDHVLAYMGVADRNGLDHDKLVVLFTTLCAIQDGEIRPGDAFPDPEAAKQKEEASKAAANDVDALRLKVSESLQPTTAKQPAKETAKEPSKPADPVTPSETETAAELERKLADRRAAAQQGTLLGGEEPAGSEPSEALTEILGRIAGSKTIAGLRRTVASIESKGLSAAEMAQARQAATAKEEKLNSASA